MMTSVGTNRARGNWEQPQNQNQTQHKQRPQVKNPRDVDPWIALLVDTGFHPMQHHSVLWIIDLCSLFLFCSPCFFYLGPDSLMTCCDAMCLFFVVYYYNSMKLGKNRFCALYV